MKDKSNPFILSLKRLYQIREACQIIGNLLFDLENPEYPREYDVSRAKQFLSKNKEH